MLNFDTSNDDNFEQPENMQYMLSTLDVTKLDGNVNDSNDEQP